MGLRLFLDMTVFHVKDQIGNKLTDKSLVNHIEQVSFVTHICFVFGDSTNAARCCSFSFRERQILQHYTAFVEDLSLSV